MGSFHALLAASFMAALRAMVVQRSPAYTSTSGESVLIIDGHGPTRESGDGLRVMGMLMDLRACGHHVEVLSDATNYSALKRTWKYHTSEDYLAHVHFWKPEGGRLPADFHLTSFDRFIIGAKADLLHTNGTKGFAVRYIIKALQEKGVGRSKVSVFFDDVPFERCQMRPDATQICPRAPGVVKDLATIASRFYVLSVHDKTRIVSDMQAHGVPMKNLDVKIWPMRIANMQKALPAQPFTPSANRNLVVMVGNNHSVNRYMITRLFESGAVKTICEAIQKQGSSIRLLFMGGLAGGAQEMVGAHPDTSKCVDVRQGFTSDGELAESVYPHTRALLNPFFMDIKSGISVKNFESIMSGVPFLTSEYGMHGLSDEVQACASFPMPSNPNDPQAFAQFFVDNVVDDDGYKLFAFRFGGQAPLCAEGQALQYPVTSVC